MTPKLLASRTVYELQPVPGRRPYQVEAATQKELVVQLKEVLKLEDKEARSAAYLLDAGGQIAMPTWSAKPIGKLEFAALTEPKRPTKSAEVVSAPVPTGIEQPLHIVPHASGEPSHISDEPSRTSWSPTLLDTDESSDRGSFPSE